MIQFLSDCRKRMYFMANMRTLKEIMEAWPEEEQ